jgi:hypothetical protein
MLFSDLDVISNALPTVRSPYSNIIDETKAARRIFPTVMARRPNGDEGSPWWVGRTSGR